MMDLQDIWKTTQDCRTDSRHIDVAWVSPRQMIINTAIATTSYDIGTMTGSTFTNLQCLSYDIKNDNCYIYYDGEMIEVQGEYITEKTINKEKLKEIKDKRKKEEWRRKLKEKRIQIKLGKAEDRGLELLERMINKNQMKTYKKDGFIDVKDYKGNICRIFKNDNKFLEVYEKKKKIVIAKDMTTIDKMNKMDEFVLNGETFVLKKKICTHHKNYNMPDVDGVISKIIHLRAGIDYGKFGNIYKHERSA